MHYSWEPIGGGLSVAVTDSCRFSQDALLLARFAAPRSEDTACDLGSGSGIIPLLWCRRNPPVHITAVEKEPALKALLDEAVARFALENRLTALCADWNELSLPAGSMSLVTCNPPYFPFGASRPSPDPLRDAARRESGDEMLAELCTAAAKLLTPQGRFCFCHRPERLADVFEALSNAGLRVRRLQFVQTREGCAPWLFLCEAGFTGTLAVLSPLISGEKGSHTAVYKRLYR